MSVSSHLRIDLREYDRRIRTFIPHYDEMLDAAATVLRTMPARAPTIVDLGIGTGALAARCLGVVPRARLIGFDLDADILAVARRRLARRARRGVTVVLADFTRTDVPACDAVVASLALHHVPTADAKTRLYRRLFEALPAGGLLVIADCCLGTVPGIDGDLRRSWRAHLLRSYAPARADAFLRAWAKEDVYFPLDAERRMIERAGFAVDVVWRRAAFAVLVGTKPKARTRSRGAASRRSGSGDGRLRPSPHRPTGP